jgi:DNA polymerase-1
VTRFQTLATLMREAVALGCEFHVRGDRVVRHGDLPDDLAQQLDAYADLLPAYCDIARDDAEAIAFFSSLGVELVHVATADAVPGTIAQLVLDRWNNDAVPVGIDIETSSYAPPPPLIVRLTSTGALHGTPLKREKNPLAVSPHTARICTLQCYAGGSQVFVVTGEALPPMLRDPWLQRTDFVAHSMNFERAFLHRVLRDLGVPPLPPSERKGRWDDTQQAATLIVGPGFNGSLQRLEAISERFLNLSPPKALQLSNWSWNPLTHGQLCYAATDAVLTWRLWRTLKPLLTERSLRVSYRLQMSCLPAVEQMEQRGCGFDGQEHDGQQQDWTTELSEARTAFHQVTGRPPPNCHEDVRKELKRILTPLEQASWPRTKGGNLLSVDQRHLKRLGGIPAARPMQRLLALGTLLQSFGPSFKSKLNPATGRFHPQFKVAGAETGRFACSDPNLQQLPSKRAPGFRKCIVAGEDKLLIAGDYSQVEVRSGGWISGDPSVNTLFEQGRDIHAEMAAKIASIAVEYVTETQRSAAKACVFGALFGISARGLADYAFNNYDVELSEDEAQELLDGFAEQFPVLWQWRDDNYWECRNRGYILIPTSGRRIDVEWSNLNPKNLPFTLCCNAPIQGSVADLIMLAIRMVTDALIKHSIVGENGLICCVHDELLLEASRQRAEEAKSILHQVMVKAFELTFPGAPIRGLVKVKMGRNWSQME